MDQYKKNLVAATEEEPSLFVSSVEGMQPPGDVSSTYEDNDQEVAAETIDSESKFSQEEISPPGEVSEGGIDTDNSYSRPSTSFYSERGSSPPGDTSTEDEDSDGEQTWIPEYETFPVYKPGDLLITPEMQIIQKLADHFQTHQMCEEFGDYDYTGCEECLFEKAKELIIFDDEAEETIGEVIQTKESEVEEVNVGAGPSTSITDQVKKQGITAIDFVSFQKIRETGVSGEIANFLSDDTLVTLDRMRTTMVERCEDLLEKLKIGRKHPEIDGMLSRSKLRAWALEIEANGCYLSFVGSEIRRTSEPLYGQVEKGYLPAIVNASKENNIVCQRMIGEYDEFRKLIVMMPEAERGMRRRLVSLSDVQAETHEEGEERKIIRRASCGWDKFENYIVTSVIPSVEARRRWSRNTQDEPQKVTAPGLNDKERDILQDNIKSQCVYIRNHEDLIRKMDKKKEKVPRVFVCHAKEFWAQPLISDPTRTRMVDGSDMHLNTYLVDQLIDYDCTKYGILFNQVISDATRLDREGNLYIEGDDIYEVMERVKKNWRYYTVPRIIYNQPKSWWKFW